MTFRGDIQDLQRAEVIDRDGDKVGGVRQVFLTNDSDQPSWVTVNTGFFGTKETFIPLAEAQFADGAITVPYEKAFIKDAPRIDEHDEISVEQEDELYRYYGVTDAPGAGHEGLADGTGTTGTTAGTAGAGVGTAGAGVGTAGAGVGTTGTADRDGDRHEGRHERLDEHRADHDADRDHDRGLDRDGAEGVTLHEERVDVGTERRQTGKARLRKYVVTDTEQVEVPVEREEVVLEREPASGRGNGRIGEEEAEVTLTEERPVVDKETVATEDVSLGKRTVRDSETVNTEVAHEEVDVDGVRENRDGLGRDADRDGRTGI